MPTVPQVCLRPSPLPGSYHVAGPYHGPGVYFAQILTEEEKAGLEFKFVMLGKRGEVEWQPTDNNKPGDSKGTDAPCTQREGLLILHRPWNGEALSSLPVYVPSTNGAATNGAATNGAVTNGAATNGAAATGNGSAKSQEKVRIASL